MLTHSISDLAMNMLLQRQSKDARLAMAVAGHELTTGQSADLRKATGGNLNQLFSIDRTLARLDQRHLDMTLAGNRASAVQLKLGIAQEIANETGLKTIAALDRGDLLSAKSYANEAKSALTQVVSALNTNFGGRQLFAGAAEDQNALAPAQQIIDDVAALITGAADSATAITAIEAYFNDPGAGFETSIYTGAAEDAAPVETAEGARFDYLVRADARPVRDLLRGLAISAAVAGGAAPGGGSALDADLLRNSGNAVLRAHAGIVDIRAELGIAEEEIEIGRTTAMNEKVAMQMARTDIAGVDQYEAAARFNSLQGQLESVYTVTARLSGLRLTNFLR